jgi:flagellar biosynthesis/type III secretory pathway protein FliH
MATVIKASGPVRGIDGALFNLDDMSGKANQYLDQIRLQAAKIVQQAQQDADAIRKRAEADGQKAALQAVERITEDKVSKQMSTLLPALRQTVESVAQAKQAWLNHWEKSAVHVACAIAGRVIRREVSNEPAITVQLIREALELAAGSSEIRLKLHPNDFNSLGGQVKRLSEQFSKIGSVAVVSDPEITLGSCRVDTRFGTVDQQFESQLTRIEEELT